MSNNYQWNKQMANERIQRRYQEAESHRQAKLAAEAGPQTPAWYERLWNWLSGSLADAQRADAAERQQST